MKKIFDHWHHYILLFLSPVVSETSVDSWLYRDKQKMRVPLVTWCRCWCFSVIGNYSAIFVIRGVRQGFTNCFDVGGFLLPYRNFVLYTCECDDNQDFLDDRMLDGHYQISTPCRFVIPKGPRVAQNSGKNSAPQNLEQLISDYLFEL